MKTKILADFQICISVPLSNLRSSLQLIVIKNRIKITTKVPRGIKLKFTQNIYNSTLKQACKGNSIQK